MTQIKLINPSGLEPPFGFSHVAEANGWIWVTPQSSSDASGNILHAGNMVGQVGQALRNVATALAEVNCQPHDVVKMTYFVTDIAAYKAALVNIGAVYHEVMGHHYPATSFLEIKSLFRPDALIEIECVAIRSELT
ncbi:MAG: RidA family protein [Chloroflexota bacterium]